jgi:hypothetical protein
VLKRGSYINNTREPLLSIWVERKETSEQEQKRNQNSRAYGNIQMLLMPLPLLLTQHFPS